MSVIFSKQIIDYPSPFIHASDLEVGEIVSMDIWDAHMDFIVVHKGNPNTNIYDSSCDGIWLLCKDLYKSTAIGASGTTTSYGTTSLHNYINDTVFSTLDAKVQACVKEVKIPYYKDVATWDDEYSYYKHTKTVYTKSSGVSAKLFSLSRSEMNDTYYPDDGSCLAYFNHAINVEDYRVAILYSGSSTSSSYWLRTPGENRNYPISYCTVRPDSGNFNSEITGYNFYVRPACIIYHDTKINSETGAILGR